MEISTLKVNLLYYIPYRGVSCLKRLKTRLRSRLSQKMLNSLMLISINGPEPFSEDAEDLIKASVQRYLAGISFCKICAII